MPEESLCFDLMYYVVMKLGLVLERTQKVRTSNSRTLAYPNFEPDKLMPKNQYQTQTLKVEIVFMIVLSLKKTNPKE